MGKLRGFLIVAAAVVLPACAGPSPSSPTATSPRATEAVAPVPPSAGVCGVIGFEDLQTSGAPFSTYSACGFTVRATTTNWTVSTGYGKPAPFILFNAPAGSTTEGEIAVSADGGRFTFQSVDIYSSTTRIPYAITGIANSTTAFTIQGTQGNTFGNFATIANPNLGTAIDTLVIRLSNPAAPCCPNPVGLDNIRLQK